MIVRFIMVVVVSGLLLLVVSFAWRMVRSPHGKKVEGRDDSTVDRNIMDGSN